MNCPGKIIFKFREEWMDANNDMDRNSGLNLTWKAGFRKVMVESDSQSDVLPLKRDIPLYHTLYNIIHACKFHMENDWSYSIHHIYRESNRVADSLDNLEHSLIFGITVFEDPPLQIFDILDDECNGVAIARMVPCS
ncbi:hypothetical protein Ddye_000979 [Dipteronia dyeriana]|uniref:RNase H type-1 domain-containing protein n=1 Tax=Dipteronia dyeriana TaxID=168575 RepID=A0AAD9XNC8_9ROSI|nr:hypothetical protein Ddye_000979 [Dipteronia dyeriana]